MKEKQSNHKIIFQLQHPVFSSSSSASCSFRQPLLDSIFLIPWLASLYLVSYIAFNNVSKAVVTFSAAKAEVSTNMKPFLSAINCASSISTYLHEGSYRTLSILFPTNITYISGSALLIKFSIHVSNSSNVSR